MQNDPVVVLAAVQQNGMALRICKIFIKTEKKDMGTAH